MSNIDKVNASLKKRYRRERLFRLAGLMSVIAGFLFLVLLLFNVIATGFPAFQQTYIKLGIHFDPELLTVSPEPSKKELRQADYLALIKSSLRETFPSVRKRKEKKKLYRLVSTGAVYHLRDMLIEHPDWLNTTRTIWVLADDDVDTFYKSGQLDNASSTSARLSQAQIHWIYQLEQKQQLEMRLSTTLLSESDSREAELAGIRGALKGSFYTMLVTLALSFPVGVAAALYLEEFAKQNRWTDLIEVNINNLAAVPSIVFGLLGLAVFINFFGMPRSAPLVGGIVLSLMTLPTIIIASRSALKAVPPSIRQAALGLGASNMQMVFHHVVPIAMPGILTGTIIGMAQALGETAPLLMIGMVAFIVDIPQGIVDPATVLPVQIFLWSDNPERAFVAKTSAAILLLLLFLIAMNTLAVLLRKKFERRW